MMDLCDRTVRRPGSWVARIWWEQEGIDLVGTRERDEAAADGEEDRGGKRRNGRGRGSGTEGR